MCEGSTVGAGAVEHGVRGAAGHEAGRSVDLGSCQGEQAVLFVPAGGSQQTHL